MSESFYNMKPDTAVGHYKWFSHTQLQAASRGSIPLTDGCDPDRLFYTHDDEEFHIEFFVGSCVASSDTDKYYNRVFAGCGPSGDLRELRHTYWGEPDTDGYTFYVDRVIILQAFRALERWFDFDQETV